jgi:hypothetical protein
MNPHVAALANRRFGVPDGVPRPVFAAVDIAVERVHLHAARVDAELKRAPPVVERVDHEADRVVVARHVAVGQVGAERRHVRIGSPAADIQFVAIVGDETDCLDGRRRVVAGKVLVLDGNGSRLPPCRLLQAAIEQNRRTRRHDL